MNGDDICTGRVDCIQTITNRLGTGFTPKLFKAEQAGTVYFCGCKHSAAGATCDGAHKSLPPPAGNLTAEEQMKRFEKDLKEKDWGHQPC